MANLAQIQSIAQGQFFVKDSLGNLTELKVGDTVSLNDTIVAASSNTDLSKIEILFDTNELITLSQGEQLLDTTLLASTFGNEELAFDKQEVDETLNAWNNAQDGDETDMETAAGDVTEQATNAGDERAADGGALRSKFNSRDGDATDIVSDLREASWAGGIERTNEDSENMLLEQPLPVVYTIIEGIDVVNEGDSANYVVKLQDAAGNPVIATQDTIIYVRYTNKTTQDGDTQYNNENIIEVVIKAGTSQTEFTIKTNDDYLADNGEIYNVSITGNNSTEFDMRTGDVAGNKTNVDTTILDNSNPLNPGGEDGGYGSEDIVFAIIEGTTTVNEGDTAQYVVKLVDKDGNPVTVTKDTTVTVVYKDKTTNDGLDTNKSNGEKITVVIKANETSAEFKVETKDDYLADNGEVYNVAIEKVEDQGQFEKVNIGDINGDKTNVDTEILDNSKDTPTDPYDQTTTPPVESDLDTITIRLFALDKDGNRVPANEVAEGSPASYVAVAFDKNGVELTLNETVEVTFGKTGDSATAGRVDYDSTTQTVTLGKPFSTNTVDDYLADNSEIYSVQITDKTLSNANKYETVVIDTTSVTTTIKDDTDNTPNDPNDNKVEDNQEQVLLKIFAADSTGAPLKDGSGNYLTVNEVPEGNKAYYVVLAFKPNETTFSDSTKLTIQSGSVEIQTFDKTSGLIATGTAFQTANDGTQDYVLKTQTVNLGDAIEVQTLDDWKADNGEQYEVKITDKSYEHPITGAVYENVKTDLNAVTTTIKDDTDNTPNNPNDNKVEENQEQVILKIVVSDANGVPKTDAQGNYIVVNNVNEGVDSHYVVLAFEPTSNGVYSTVTKLADNLQGGTVTVSTQSVENGATGVTTASKIDGSQDYITKSTIEIKVGGGTGNVFSVKTIDDYKAETEANETFKVVIDTNSYKHPENDVSKAIYENVTIDNSGVTTTIVDNTSAKNQTIGTSGEDVNSNTYGQEDTVWAIIEAVNSNGNKIDNPSVVEGNTVTYRVKLVDKDGKAVTVSSDTNVTIKFEGVGTNVASLDDLLKLFGSDGTTEISGFDNTNQELTISIPKGSSFTQFTIQTKDDFTAEGNETFDLSISEIDSTEFENLVFDKTKAGEENKVTTEIKDGVTLGTPKNAYVDEDNFYKNDFNNTDSSSEYTTKNISNLDNKTGHIKGDLGIIAPNGDNGYTLSFDNTIKVYKGNENGTETNIYGDGTALKSGGQIINYQIIGNKIIGYIGNVLGDNDFVSQNNKVFEITLNKNNAGGSDDNYTYTQYKNIDHPVAGDATNSINDDNITFEFGFKITDQDSTSKVQKFKVTVNDSTPIAGENTLTIYEDNNGKNKGAYTFVLSDESFKNGSIEIDNGKDGYQTIAKNGTVNIYDGDEIIGTLTNKGNGTLTFKPNADYSKYEADNGYLPNFKYKVSDTDGDYAQGQINIQVKPGVDGVTITTNKVETYEDNKNTQEGQNSVSLGLVQPTIKDNTDKNDTAKGDHGERVDYITLNFTNGTSVKGAVLEKADGNDIATISSNNQTVKIVIVKADGSVDTDFHHSNITLGQSGVVYLTKEEYEGLKIQHAEDNDTDIKINISTKTYEVDDSGKPLSTSQANNQGKTDSATVTVVIKPVTDDISLKWNDESAGTISDSGKTYTFNDIKEGNDTIDLKALLTKTSGTELNDSTTGNKADLDGSEKRTYTISGIPEGTVVTLGGQTTVANKDGDATIEFDNTNNKDADPDFSMKFPENYSGTVNAKITLNVIDKGNGTEHTNNNGTEKIGADGQGEWGEVKTAEVNFKVNVNPVADDATVKVGQPVGYEDAGRTSLDKDGKYDKNIQDKDGTIKHPENGIKLPIEVTSTDTDGSETFTVTIKDIPNGSGLYVYDKSSASYKLVEVSNDGTITIYGQAVTGDKSGNISVKEENGKFAVEIKDYQNTEQPKFIPPHNSHGDFPLKVDAKTVDTVIIDGQPVTNVQDVATNKDILVVVKDVADSVVGNDYNQETLVVTPNTDDKVIGTHKQYNVIVNEDDNGGKISLNSIFTDSTKLASYDSASEDLTIVIKSLPKGVELEGNVTLINGQYIFKASDIPSIKIVTPANYSGELNFDITYITTEKGEANNPSKTHDSNKHEPDKISIFVKPTIDAQFDSQTTKAEDSEIVDGGNSYYKVDLGISHQNGDNDETLESVTIKAPEANSGYKLFIIDGNTKTEITSDYTLKTTELNKVYVEVKENQHGSFDIKGTYTVKDSQYAGKDVNYETKETKDFTHKLTITPVTDTPTIEVETGTQTHINVNAGENTEIKIPVKVSSGDKDGSENITKIVISGVPQGVTVDGLTNGQVFENGNFINVSIHNGIYTITGHNLNSDSFKDIVFNVGAKADFEHRDITITSYTQDAQGSIEEQTSTKITLDKIHNGNGGGTGTGPKLDIVVDETKKDFKATEDTQFNFLDAFKVTVADNSNDGRTELNFKIDVGSNATLKGLDAYKNADGSYTIKGNSADIESVLANLKIIPNKDFNSNQDIDGISIKVEANGGEITTKVPVTPVTDAMTVEITSNDSTTINENGEFNFDIKLTNNSDKEFTKINDFYVVVNEKFEAGESSKGELYLGNTKLELVDGKYKLPADYKLGESLNLTYKSGEDRHGTVDINVIAKNNETGATNELTSIGGTTSISVKPVVSSEIRITDEKPGVEDDDKQMASVKLSVDKYDPSEKFESVLIKVESGVAVYYDNGTKLAMNLGGDSWLIPVSGDGKTLPEIFFKGKEHLAGNIGFKATINAKDGEAKVTKELTTGSVTITEVADGVTIDPTKTGIDKNAFEWTTLNLNANMKDLDGSEKMYLELKGLGAFAQFKLKDGGIVESEYDSVNKVWTIKDIAYDKINDIQFTNDKDTTVDIKAWTTDGIDSTREKPATGSMEVDFAKNAVENGKFTLGKEVNIDFSKIENGDIKDINTIDLGAEGKNELLNLKLEDVLSLTNPNKELIILGKEEDTVSFAKDAGWQKSETTEKIGEKTFEVWSNTGDESLKVKVEQPISDGITN